VDLEYFEGALDRLSGGKLVTAERQAYGIDHAEVGSEILRLADVEAHKRFLYATDIDRIEQTLVEKPE